MFSGFIELSYISFIIITFALTYLTVLSVTLYLHRFSAHRGFKLHPILQHFFRLWLWITTGMSTKEWTAIHRKHHAKCETAEDPHSPAFKGLATVLFKGVVLYRNEAKNQETMEKYGKGTPNDWLERHVYTRFGGVIGVVTMLLIDFVLFGAIGVAVWAIQMAWIPFFAAGVVNGLGHRIGYRNFETADTSTNLTPWGILLCGEELHNNHHAFPNSPKFSIKWWEFDAGWFWIKLFSWVGLAKVGLVKRDLHTQTGKTEIDWNTVLAILNNRVQVMAQYSKQVINPLINMEKAAAASIAEKRLFRRAKRLLCREKTFIRHRHVERVNLLLKKYSSLQITHSLRVELQAIWQKTSASKQELLSALKEWCQKAEQSGVKKLQEFAKVLKSYTLLGQTSEITVN